MAEKHTALSFLFCNHPLYPRQADEDYAAEFHTARQNYPSALFSYEDLEQGKLSLYGEKLTGLTIYRGWMMKPEMYRTFYRLLEREGITLINTPEEYETYHLLPNWYESFKQETSESFWTSSVILEDALCLAKKLEGAYIVKDYVKSRKHEWADACYIEDIQKNGERVIRNFIERQGDDLVGGVVLRRFESLKQIGFHARSGMPISEEYRVFIYAGNVLAIDNYWTDRHDSRFSKEELTWIDSIASRVHSNFVTVDLARKTDGKLIIMEFGDGQVSGLQQLEAESFYKAFTKLSD